MHTMLWIKLLHKKLKKDGYDWNDCRTKCRYRYREILNYKKTVKPQSEKDLITHSMWEYLNCILERILNSNFKFIYINTGSWIRWWWCTDFPKLYFFQLICNRTSTSFAQWQRRWRWRRWRRWWCIWGNCCCKGTLETNEVISRNESQFFRNSGK